MAKRNVIALKRFGLGQTRRQMAEIGSDPVGFVVDQLERPDVLSFDAGLPSARDGWLAHVKFAKARRALAKKVEKDAFKEAVKKLPKPPNYRLEVKAHVAQAIGSDTPFVERLCWFWANHFCVSARNGGKARHSVGGYVREAIRPHVLGNFRDMLGAVVEHPSMLYYLDNHRSVGPDSKLGKRRKVGLNENLAREILELHTLGVDGGYTQQDILNLTYALTGWSIPGDKKPGSGSFRFFANRHQPGAVTVLGKRYGERGQEQALAILDDLAQHPSTARFIARKLARHFISNKPPASVVNELARTFTETQGDLKEVARVLAMSEAAWDHEPSRLLPPLDMVVTVYRALGTLPKLRFLMRTLNTFGQKMWAPPSPAGWPDEGWENPAAIVERLDWMQRISQQAPQDVLGDVSGFARDLFEDAISKDTMDAIENVKDPHNALSLLFMSREVQRR